MTVHYNFCEQQKNKKMTDVACQVPSPQPSDESQDSQGSEYVPPEEEVEDECEDGEEEEYEDCAETHLSEDAQDGLITFADQVGELVEHAELFSADAKRACEIYLKSAHVAIDFADGDNAQRFVTAAILTIDDAVVDCATDESSPLNKTAIALHAACLYMLSRDENTVSHLDVRALPKASGGNAAVIQCLEGVVADA